MENLRQMIGRWARARWLVLGTLIVTPILIYIGFGTFALWQTGWLASLWWWIPALWVLAWIVARCWKPTTPVDHLTWENHWTPRDQAAAQIVEEFQKQAGQFTRTQLSDPHFYLEQAQQLSLRLVRHYHRSGENAYSHLTVPEILAAVRLVADDLEQLALHALPGSRWLTIQQYRRLQQSPRQLKKIRDGIWFASMLLNPLNVVRYGTARATLGSASRGLQRELLTTLYARFIRQCGFYLIEMNSGRLRGGADLYLQAFGKRRSDSRLVPDTIAGFDESLLSGDGDLKIGLVGQVSSGKSSIVNALIGEHAAATDLLPETRLVRRFQLQLPDSNQVTLLDTPGYGEAGATPVQLREIERVLLQADLVLLILDAHCPARAADQATLQQLTDRQATHPELKPPPVICVLTHVDLLPPPLEWSPPYNWEQPSSKKEQNLADAVAYNHKLFHDRAQVVVPVCADPDRLWGVDEYLIPAIARVLPEAQMVLLMEAFEKALGSGRLAQIYRQFKHAGSLLWATWAEQRTRPRPTDPGKPD